MFFSRTLLSGLGRTALPDQATGMFDSAEGSGAGLGACDAPREVQKDTARAGMGAPIFVQAMWRASSTYVWKKFREKAAYRAYCEPLHEILTHPMDVVRRMNGPEVWKRLRHPVNDEFYFVEFPFSDAGGVEHFEKALSFERYCLEETERDEPLRRYVAGLLAHAESHGERAVLQFNRGLLRAGWLARQFHPVQILLLRNPLNLWKSFLSYPGPTFPTYVSMIFGQNRHRAPLRYLPRWMEFPRFVRPTVSEEWKLYQAFTAENLDRLYPSFFDLFVLSSVHCAQFADCILDLDEITRNPEVRRAATERLRALGIAIDLEDCDVPGYDAKDADREWLAYEEFGRKFLRQALPDDVSISAERMKSHERLLGPYFRDLLAGFTGRRGAASPEEAAEKSASAAQLFAKREFGSAARVSGEALAAGPTSTRWNDWAVTQAACSRRRLAELGFRQALRSEPVDREAAGNLGALLLADGRPRQALLLLERAELETETQARAVFTKLVNKTRRSLGLSPEEAREKPLDLLRAQKAALDRVTGALAKLEERVEELSGVVSRHCAATAATSELPAQTPAVETARTRRRRRPATNGRRAPAHAAKSAKRKPANRRKAL